MKQQLPSNEDVSFGIRVRMAELKMTRNDLAEKTGYSKHKITLMCGGNHDFSLDEIATLEKVLDTTLILVPDTERVITVTMHIDSHRHQATVGTTVTENGRPVLEEDWDIKKLVATANALTAQAQKLQNLAIYKMIEEEK
jgi:DNA-binding Xre family transcriptional regulator